MNERIINLLRLCMAAQEKGINIDFTKSKSMVQIFDFDCPATHTTKAFHIFLNDGFAHGISEAEEYLKGLIANAHT